MSNFLQTLSEILPLADTKQKIIVLVFFLTIIIIPTFSILMAQRTTLSQANNDPRTFDLEPVTEPPKEVPKTDALTQLQQEAGQIASPAAEAPLRNDEQTTAVSFGPTLSFKVIIEGRPDNNQSSSKFFIGIAAGSPTDKPTYLLSFTVDIPNSGIFDGISLAGLESGSEYTAYLKGSAQLATTSAFLMNPGVSILNNDSPLHLLSGDLNDDNVINTTDFSLAKAAFGSTAASANWSQRADLNIDGVVNTIDLGIIGRNIDKTGLSGAWYSTTPSASQSAVPNGNAVGGAGYEQSSSPSGYWIWVPQ